MIRLLPGEISPKEVFNEKSFQNVIHEKRFSPRELINIEIQLIQLGVPRETIDALEKLFTETANQLMTGDGLVITDGAVFNEFFAKTYKEGLLKATEDGFENIKNAPKRLQEWFKNNVSPVPVFSTESAFVRAMYNDGFKLITSKLTINFYGEALDAIAKGVQNGDGWMQIASNMNKVAGTKAAWHWKRLVRTEMCGAFYGSSVEQYEKMGVQYVKWSMVATACEICRGYAEDHQGWYLLGHETPQPVHPNDRCRYIPRWNKPRGLIAVGE
jgi:hypothetical protein